MRKLTIAWMVSLVWLSAPTVWAQSINNWPERPITIISTATPGGIVDTLARILAEGVAEYLGQPVIVENRGGASGTIGLQAALRAPADGYTYVSGYPSNLIVSHFTFESLSFNAQRDFQAVVGISTNEMVVNVKASVPVTNPQELVAWARQQSGKLVYGSYGQGSYGHIVADYLGTLYQYEALHVPYKGEQDVMLALASDTNEVAYAIAAMPASKRMQDTGKTRMIGVLASERSALYPDLPTFKEMGISDPTFQLLGWYGLFARKDVPEPVVRKMQDAVLHVLSLPHTRERMAAVSGLPWPVGAQALQSLWFADLQVYENLLRSTKD